MFLNKYNIIYVFYFTISLFYCDIKIEIKLIFFNFSQFSIKITNYLS